MRRRDILRLDAAAASAGHPAPLAKRQLGKTGVDLSIIALGGVLVMHTEQSFANNIVAEAFDRGVNYFDVAPSYGNAQERLGPALEPYRDKVFLACKTTERSKSGSAKELEESLRLLRTDHLDLYQFHAVTTKEDVEKIFGPDGAMETFAAARKAGKVRFLGFSAHSVENALAMMDRFDFDTILFPVNFVLFSQANFGPQVLKRAREKEMGILALKAMAKAQWPPAEKEHHPFPKCWYKPAELPDEAALALRWTLSQPITAAVPPGEEKYFRRALEVAARFTPIHKDEEKTLMAGAQGAVPLFRLATA
jgi:aryl-alcohol dehydrogenase-like predicted oxidoreductase